MKKTAIIIGILAASFINVLAQDVNLSYNKAFVGEYAAEQNVEAEALLYREVNYYRVLNGVDPVAISERIVGYATRFGNYTVSKHNTPEDNFYEHSKFGPDSLQIPVTCSEIIHMVYFDHKPSPVELCAGLMYGISRPPSAPVVGWTQSPGHKETLLQDIVKYYGAAIYVFRTTHNWWVCFGIVNFSTTQ